MTDSCRYCGTALSALDARQGSCCRNAGCRHQASLARWQSLRQTLGEPALLAAQLQLHKPPAALLWLEPAMQELVDLPDERRAAHLDHLLHLVAGAADEPLQALAPASSGHSLGPQEGRLCAQCVGRCCAAGRVNHAFITLPQLLRWQQSQTDSSLHDAVQAFMAHLPTHHIRDGCVYQGAKGCVLPRSERADICNSFACAPLALVQQTLQDQPDAAFVAITRQGNQALRQAVITASETLPLSVPGTGD